MTTKNNEYNCDFRFRKLKIGYYSFGQLYECHPGNVRAVDEAVALLKGRGHTLVPVS